MTRSYGVFDHGMIADPDVLKLLAEKRCKDYDEQEFSDDKMSYVESLYERGDIDMIPSFTGESLQIADDGEVIWGRGEHYDGECLFYIPYRPKVHTPLTAPLYNIEEFLNHLKQEFGDALGSDFDFRSRVRFIVGIYYG